MTPIGVKVFAACSTRLAAMPMPAGLTLREATLGDLPAILSLRESVGWTPHEWAMRAVIGQGDTIFVVAEDDGGGIAAMGSGIVYPPSIGFIGNMVVAPALRRRGVGSEILDAVAGWLSRAGCDRLELNATDEGRPLYERHGFASRGTSAAVGISRRALRRLGPASEARPIWLEDLERLAAYDRPRFGGDRSRLLELLTTDGIARGLLVERDGEMAGYAFLQAEDHRLGPMVADTPEMAVGLVAAMFEAEPELADVRLNLPPGNAGGAEWLKRVRVAMADWDGRMCRGPEIPRRDETIYQMTVGPLG
jgi:GNAT superfamily N-acetyltransferase